MTSQPGKHSIAIDMSPNVSRSKSNHGIKVGHLIEYNIRIIFLEKSYTKCDEKLFSGSFLKNQN